MAETLKADSKVVQLKTAKARGAGGAKGARKGATKLKPAPHVVPKPPADEGDAERRARAAQVERIAALTQQHRAMDHKIEGVRATIDELNGQRKLIRTAIKNSSIRLDVFDERYEKLKLKTKRTDLNAIERERAICSEAMGLPVGEQESLDFDTLPEGAKGGVYWRAEGYRAGVAGEAHDPVAAGVPPESIKDYGDGWNDGQAVVGRGFKTLDKEPAAAPKPKSPKASKPANAPTQPDWTGFDDDPEVWTVAQRAVFRTWYNALGDEEVDIDHPGVEVAFDRALESGHAFLTSDEDRAALESDGGEILH